ncbi:MAG: AI-2E family transporter, partial [Lachnospiraceae bacterium]|nr:AI-2E family transporter [Lachnospiraceae bacterium]
MESNQVKKYCIIGVIAAAVCLFVMNVKVVIAAGTAVLSAAAPLLFGIVIAYILNILLKKIEKWYFPKAKNPRLIASRRPVSIVLAFMALLVIVILLANLVVPELILTIRLMAEEIPPAAEAVRLWAIENSGEIPAIQESLQNLNIDWESTIRKALEVVAVGAGGLFSSVVTVIGSLFGT